MKSKLSTTLSKLRRERKLSQRQAAAQLGVSQALLSHYENDAREPGVDFIIKACDFYEVRADYLLGRSDERKDGASILSGKVNVIVDSLDELKKSEAELISNLRELITENAK